MAQQGTTKHQPATPLLWKTRAEPYSDPDLEWNSNSLALRMADSLKALERLYRDHSRDMDECRDLACAAGVIEVQIMQCREIVARRCAPWFDGSAFEEA